MPSAEYELHDHLGTTRVSFDETTGNTKSYWNGLSYGYMQLDREYGASLQQRFGFNGKERDNKLGTTPGYAQTINFSARLYTPMLGRWMSLDPLAKKYPAISPYAFAANNPIAFRDPDGRKIQITGGNNFMNDFATVVNTELGMNILSGLGHDALIRVAEVSTNNMSRSQKALYNLLQQLYKDPRTYAFSLSTIAEDIDVPTAVSTKSYDPFDADSYGEQSKNPTIYLTNLSKIHGTEHYSKTEAIYHFLDELKYNVLHGGQCNTYNEDHQRALEDQLRDFGYSRTAEAIGNTAGNQRALDYFDQNFRYINSVRSYIDKNKNDGKSFIFGEYIRPDMKPGQHVDYRSNHGKDPYDYGKTIVPVFREYGDGRQR